MEDWLRYVASVEEVDARAALEVDGDLAGLFRSGLDTRFYELGPDERAAVGMPKLMSMYDREDVLVPALGDSMDDTSETGFVYGNGTVTCILYKPLLVSDIDTGGDGTHALIVSREGFSFDNNVDGNNGPFKSHRSDRKITFPKSSKELASTVARVMIGRDDDPWNWYDYNGEPIEKGDDDRDGYDDDAWYDDSDDYIILRLEYDADDDVEFCVVYWDTFKFVRVTHMVDEFDY